MRVFTIILAVILLKILLITLFILWFDSSNLSKGTIITIAETIKVVSIHPEQATPIGTCSLQKGSKLQIVDSSKNFSFIEYIPLKSEQVEPNCLRFVLHSAVLHENNQASAKKERYKEELKQLNHW